MDPSALALHRLRNHLQALLLVAFMGLLCAYLALLLGGTTLAWMTLVLVVFAYALNPVASPRLVMRLYRARRLSPGEAPQIRHLLALLSERAGLKRIPDLYYIPSQLMNAFSTGTERNAAIALSDALIRRLSIPELAGVLAHEISHIVNGDTRVMALADLTARVTSLLSLTGQFLLFLNLPLLLAGGYHIPWVPILVLVFAPTLSGLIQLALSRTREYEADRGAVALTGDPEALASALVKMEQQTSHLLEQLFLPGQRIPEPSLLRTHPRTADRIRRLMELRHGPALDLTGLTRAHLAQDEPRAPRWHRSGLWY